MRGIHHISLKAKGAAEFEVVLAFYEKVLDCPLVCRWGEGDSQGAMLDLGNTLLEVMANGGKEEKGLFAHIAFSTDDVDGMARRVQAAGRPVFLGPENKNLGGNYPSELHFVPVRPEKSWNFFRN